MYRNGRYGWGFALAAVLLGVAIAMLAYNAGVSEGLASAGTEVVRGGRWGWGGGVVVWPLLWVFFWAFMWRGACWRRRYWYGGPYRPYGPPPSTDDEFDRWHRRAHERMTEEPPADNSGRRG